MGTFINPSVTALLRQLGQRQLPRIGDADTARALLDSDDPVAESRRLLDAETPDAMPTDGLQRLPAGGPPVNLPRMGTDIPPGLGGMPTPPQASGDWKSRLLHAGQGALMGLANARRNPTNPNDWGAVVGSAIGGGLTGAVSPQSLENEKYYERDLPRWYEGQKMQSDLANKDRMQRMTEAQIENVRTDNERAQKEFEQKQKEFSQKQQTKAFEDWDLYGDPKKPLTADEAARRGLPAEMVGQAPSGGKRTGKGGRETLNTSEGIIERMPNGDWGPLMSPAPTGPLAENPVFGPRHQLQPYSTPKASPAPHTVQGGRMMFDASGKLVPTPGYAEPPEKTLTPGERATQSRWEQGQQRQYEASGRGLLAKAQTAINDAKKVSPRRNETPEDFAERRKGMWDAAESAATEASLAFPDLIEGGAGKDGYAYVKWKGGRPATGGGSPSLDEIKAQARADVKNMGETPQAKKAFKDVFKEDY